MNTIQRPRRHHRAAALAISFVAPALISLGAWGAELAVTLSGAQEVPPVATAANGKGTITINDDRTVKGSVTVYGMASTAAHIHEGALGQNGGVIVPLVKDGDAWAVPGNAKLTEAQYAAFKAGNLYVNVHSAAFPGGELRAQLKP